MFPPSLHKNIRELDKQISLLEAECDGIEGEKRKKSVNGKMFFSRTKDPVSHLKTSVKNEIERPFVTGPRVQATHSARRITKTVPEAKGCVKNVKDISRKPQSGRDLSNASGDEPSKFSRKDRNCQLCGKSREKSHSENKSKRNQNVAQCKCGNEFLDDSVQNQDVSETENKQNESEREGHILHKGILHANPGGTIEVTVTQKSAKPVNSTIQGVSCRRVTHPNKDPCLEKQNENTFIARDNQSNSKFPAKTTPRNKKWSEILSQETDSVIGNKDRVIKSKNSNNNYALCSSVLGQFISESRKHAGVSDEDINIGLQGLRLGKFEKHLMAELQSDDSKKSESSSVQQKCRSPFLKRNVLENVIDTSPRRLRDFEDKEVQCAMGSEMHGKLDINEKSGDPSMVLCYLIDILRGRNGDERYEHLIGDLQKSLKDEEMDEKKESSCDNTYEDFELSPRVDKNYVRKLQKELCSVKKLCDKLTEEKNQLTEEMVVKEQLIANFNAKEEEHRSMITNLKANLEKRRVEAGESVEVLKELNDIKDKLANETRVSDALRKSHTKMQTQIHKCILENDRLKTQLRLNKLESEKYCVLLAGKDAEIKKYREEIESFQQQISDQLAILRSHNVENEVQKAIEAIVHHSRVFSQTDLDSTLTDSQTSDNVVPSTSKQRDKLMHSSPTSTKSSGLDSSWNHISSIREYDSPGNLSRDVVNADPTRKTIPGNGAIEPEHEVLLIGKPEEGNNNCCEGDSSKHSHDTDNRKDLSFVSCKSAEDSTNDLTTGTNGNGDATGSELLRTRRSEAKDRADSPLSAKAKRRIRRDIEGLFQEIREKCTRGIFSLPGPDRFAFDELLTTDTSDFSEVSGSSTGNSEKE